MNVARHHAEVLDSLVQLASETDLPATRGEQVRVDRGSNLEHIGLRAPDRRQRVAAGFSFSNGPAVAVLEAWDGIWKLTDNGDVLFAALDTYRKVGPHFSDQLFWETTSGWIDRIDNWAHADDLARIYSFVLEAQFDLVFPTLEAWSTSEFEWHKRISMVSLIHYSGKNAVFLPAEPMLRLLGNCVDDERETVIKAIGWVLREMMATYSTEVVAFLRSYASELHPAAIRRATEKLPAAERDQLRTALRTNTSATECS